MSQGKKRKRYYEELFKEYPDVVDIPMFRKMLGGIAQITAEKLVRQNIVKHFRIRNTYMIPKIWVIDYLVSNEYKIYKAKLKSEV